MRCLNGVLGYRDPPFPRSRNSIRFDERFKRVAAGQGSTFFVPGVPAKDQEQAYNELALACGCAPAPTGKRIRSITFRSNGETWTATVGEKLSGSATKKSRAGGQRIERAVPLSNGSTVLAIFAGVPFRVWHDGASRVWSNPFLAGEPSSVTMFADGGA